MFYRDQALFLQDGRKKIISYSATSLLQPVEADPIEGNGAPLLEPLQKEDNIKLLKS